jgi:hypothetical protein
VPGRYGHNPDPQLAELLHQVTLEGWGNDSVGDVDQDGFYASLLIVEPAEQSELTDAFDQTIPVGNWIVTEDQQGFVTLDQYPTPQAARQAFTDLPDLDSPGGRRHHHPGRAARQPLRGRARRPVPRLRHRPGSGHRDAAGRHGCRPALAGCLVHQRPRQPSPLGAAPTMTRRGITDGHQLLVLLIVQPKER